MSETCQSCKFFNDGECRRYPPTVIVERHHDGYNGWVFDTVTLYPHVAKGEWCGEHVNERESEGES